MLKKIYFQPGEATLFPKNTSLPEPLFINMIANEPDWSVSAISNRSWCELLLATAGKAYYTIGHRTYTITKGDLIVFNAGMIHEAHSDPNDPIERCVCALRDVRLPGRRENQILYDRRSPVIPLGDRFETMASLFRVVTNACSHPGHNAYEAAQHAVCTILALLDELLGAQPAFSSDEAENTLSREVLAYIDQHYTLPITLESLASRFFISTDHLSHMVKAETGCTPINYLLNRRIGEAQRLLLSTMLPISRIAELVGFANINHFSGAFKKRVGMAPSRYRQDYSISSIPHDAIPLLQPEA